MSRPRPARPPQRRPLWAQALAAGLGMAAGCGGLLWGVIPAVAVLEVAAGAPLKVLGAVLVLAGPLPGAYFAAQAAARLLSAPPAASRGPDVLRALGLTALALPAAAAAGAAAAKAISVVLPVFAIPPEYAGAGTLGAATLALALWLRLKRWDSDRPDRPEGER